MYYVYILQSLKHSRYYTGQTQNIYSRLMEHNSGQTKSTKAGVPWKIIFTKELSSRAEALKLERKIKKRGAKRFLNDLN